MNKREECLRRANEIVNGQREQQYGTPAACGYEIASGDDAKVDDALMKATLSEYAPIEELARHMGARD